MENALEESRSVLLGERRFGKLILDLAPAFIVAIAMDGTTLMVNHTMLESLGYEADELVGRDYLSTLVPEAERAVVAATLDRLRGGGPNSFDENGILKKSGEILRVQWHGRVVRQSVGEDFTVGFGFDMANRKD
jgi:PAS domain S-box-containing protein